MLGLLVVLALAQAPRGATAEGVKAERVPLDPDCGVSALYLLLLDSGRNEPLARVLEAMPRAHQRGHSLAELRSAASTLGLALDGYRLTKSDFPLPDPVLADLRSGNEGHFVVLRPVGTTGTAVQVLDFPKEPIVVDYDQLTSSPSWTGMVLKPRTVFDLARTYAWLVPAAIAAIIAWRAIRQRARRSR